VADRALSRTDAVVLGAGFAGLSAAVRLAEAGRRVVVLEEAPRLGGRASAFTDRETGERVDNGQHVLFGCYRETYRFLRTIGADSLAPLQPRLSLTFAAPGGRVSTLTCPRLPPPLHLVAGVLRWPGLPLGDRLSAVRMAGFIRDARRNGPAAAAAGAPEEWTVDRWLSAHRQSSALRDWLWHPLAFAALNQAPDTAAAQPFARVVAELFGPRVEDSAVGLSKVPLDELFAEPARRYLEARGSEVRVRAPGRVMVDASGAVTGVRVGDATISAPVVISAVPWYAFARIWDGPPPPAIGDVAARALAMASASIVTVNLWLDRAVFDARFVGLVGGPMHWVFDKSAILGERAGHLSIVSSGADDLVRLDNAELTRVAVEQLRAALPAMRDRVVHRSVVVREPRATFSLAPGQPVRPGTRTPISGFFLAGDWLDTGLPATIEGAVVSGHRAAAAILSPS
jgi:squalene-associated FAD-dependent desaturase